MKNPQAHHDLPREFKDKFEAKGLDIENPENGRRVSGGTEGNHQKWSKEYNDAWREFFKSKPKASKQNIIEQRDKLRIDPKFQ